MTLQENHHTDEIFFVCLFLLLTCLLHENSDLFRPNCSLYSRENGQTGLKQGGSGGENWASFPESNPGRWEEEGPTQTPSGYQAC